MDFWVVAADCFGNVAFRGTGKLFDLANRLC